MENNGKLYTTSSESATVKLITEPWSLKIDLTKNKVTLEIKNNILIVTPEVNDA